MSKRKKKASSLYKEAEGEEKVINEKYYLEDGFPPEKREAIYREWWERQEFKRKALHRLTIIFATGSIVLTIVLLLKLL